MLGTTHIIRRVEYSVAKENGPERFGLLFRSALWFAESEFGIIIVIFVQRGYYAASRMIARINSQLMSDFWRKNSRQNVVGNEGAQTYQFGIVAAGQHRSQCIDKEVDVFSLVVIMGRRAREIEGVGGAHKDCTEQDTEHNEE